MVSVLLSLGAYNKFVCVPRIKTDPTRGALYLEESIRIELVAVGMMIITSVLMTSVPLPMGLIANLIRNDSVSFHDVSGY